MVLGWAQRNIQFSSSRSTEIAGWRVGFSAQGTRELFRSFSSTRRWTTRQRTEGGKVRSVGYSVAPAHRGRGIASSAVKALTAFAWTVPTLHRIELYIEPWNSNSIRVAEASGFQRDGLLRSHQEIGNTRRDVLLYATTRP